MNKINTKTIHSRLLKIAQDELDLTKKMPTTGEAGPQEVVDAVADIAEELQEVIAMIPAEPSNPDADDATDDPDVNSEESESSTMAPKEDPEKKELLAKLARLEKQLDLNELDKVANKIAELYPNGQEKYDSIMSSGKSSKFWSAQYETLSEFAGIVNTKPKVAQTVSHYFKVGQQLRENKESRKMI